MNPWGVVTRRSDYIGVELRDGTKVALKFAPMNNTPDLRILVLTPEESDAFARVVLQATAAARSHHPPATTTEV